VQVGAVWPRKSDVREALAPLWDDGTVEVLQLTVEQAFYPDQLGPDFTDALDEAARRGDLVGHGVFASPFTLPRDAICRDWLVRTQEVLARWPVRFLTDHFGCSRAAGWQSAPLPLPASPELVRAGRDHLAWIGDALEIPVGLENLALAFSLDDVLWQPDLLDQMVRPVGGLILLDLHNLWCSAVNFDLDPVALMERWPLDLVRQIHIAGGSWSDYPEGRFRRDTHDGPVPEEVWALLPEAIGRCPNLEVVILERLRGTLDDLEVLRGEARRLESFRDRAGVVSACGTLPPAPGWTAFDPAVVQEALVTGLRAGDLRAVEAVAPGWARDLRGLRVGVEIVDRWGRSAPV